MGPPPNRSSQYNSSMHSQALLFTGPHQVGLGTLELPPPGPGELLIEALYTCISPGTELRCLSGRQAGAPEWPYIPGYAMVGRVLEVGPQTQLSAGTLVFLGGTQKGDRARCWGGHAAHAIISEGAVYPIPTGVDPVEAALTKLAAISYHGVRLSRPQAHERVAVIGLGPIGQLSARLHALSGARVVGADLAESRIALLRTAGIEAISSAPGLRAAFSPVFPEGADVIVDSTGAPPVLAQALELGRDKPWDDTPVVGARCVIQGSYADSVPVPYTAPFMKEMSLLFPRDTQPTDLRAVLDLLARGKLRMRDLVSEICPPMDAQAAYQELARPGTPWVTAVFCWK